MLVNPTDSTCPKSAPDIPVSTLLSTKPFEEFRLFVKYILKKIKHSNDNSTND